MYEPNELHFTVDISILTHEGETPEQAEQRLADVLRDSLLTLADHEINYCFLG